MTYGRAKSGEAIFTLSAEETKRFEAGSPIKHVVGSVAGVATITLQLTYPKDPAKRFPAEAGFGPEFRNQAAHSVP